MIKTYQQNVKLYQNILINKGENDGKLERLPAKYTFIISARKVTCLRNSMHVVILLMYSALVWCPKEPKQTCYKHWLLCRVIIK